MSWITDLLRRRRIDRDLAEEIRQHLDEKADELAAGGMPREEALQAARREFGNPTLIEEDSRAVWRWTAVEALAADLRYAARQLRRSPSFTLATVLTLALGIGANTAVFSVVNAVVLLPLPFPEPDRLVAVESIDIRGGPHPTSLSYPTFFDFRARSRGFEHLVSYRDNQFTLSGFGAPLQVPGAIVSWNLFPLLKVQPALGRGFLPSEEQRGERVVVLSYELWQGRFGGDPSIVGRAIAVDRLPHTVVGIAPAGFNFPVGRRRVQIWTTLARDAASATVNPITEQRGARLLQAIARLKPGVSLAEAHAQLDGVAAGMVREYPDVYKNLPRTSVRPELERMVGDTRWALFVLFAAVTLVLLIACANVANLLLARTAEREREFAVRLAIGAGRARVVRQLLSENLLVALLGAGAGILVAFAALSAARPLAGESIPRIELASIDTRVLAFSVVIALLTAFLFSVPSALRVAGARLDRGREAGARGSTDANDGFRGALVVVQVALGLTLLSAAGLLLAAFLEVARRDPGCAPEGVLTFQISLPDNPYRDEKQAAFYESLLERLAQVPGVISVAGGVPLPLTGQQMQISFDIEERPAPPPARPSSDMAIVTPGFFKTIGAPLLRGRDFDARDTEDAPPVLIVNQAFADKFFPGEDAVGKRIVPGANSRRNQSMKREIVGVVGNVRQSPLGAEPEPIYYFPYRQLTWMPPATVVRAAIPPHALESSVRAVVASLDKEVPVYEIHTLDEVLWSGVAKPRFLGFLLGSFAAIALALTMVGLYGVLAYSVARRTREIGIRVALGATRGTIFGLVVRRAMLLVGIGIALGLGGAVAGERLLSRMLYGVGPRTPLLVSAACVLIALTAALAASLPARRAASTEPVEALRME